MAAPGSVTLSRLQVALGSSRFSFNYLLFLNCATHHLPPQEAPVSVKGKILMLVVLGSRLAISCGLNHQSSSGSLTAFHLFPFEALGWCFVFRGQLTYKFRDPERRVGWKNNLEKLLTLTLSYLI